MLRLKFPRPAVRAAGPPPPPGLRPTADRSVVMLFGRRRFLAALAAVVAAVAAPWTGVRRAWARSRGRFFTADERATLEALVDRIIPPDRDPGARALGAAEYVETLLTAFDH